MCIYVVFLEMGFNYRWRSHSGDNNLLRNQLFAICYLFSEVLIFYASANDSIVECS